jgi:hypothetical protein
MVAGRDSGVAFENLGSVATSVAETLQRGMIGNNWPRASRPALNQMSFVCFLPINVNRRYMEIIGEG